jgi:hypothetical protein
MKREVNELDFRMPQYRDAKVEDYEFRDDGVLVRKDRWERGIGSIRFLVGVDGREFEIPDVVAAVRKLVEKDASWVPVSDEMPRDRSLVDIRLREGSELKSAVYRAKDKTWNWQGHDFNVAVTDWRERAPSALESDDTQPADGHLAQ